VTDIVAFDLDDLHFLDDGRIRVRETATHFIDICPMLYTWRIVTTPKRAPGVWDRGWCYERAGLAGFLAVLIAAHAWDGSDDTEPKGFVKRAGLWYKPRFTRRHIASWHD
jgi:hypothetical protein